MLGRLLSGILLLSTAACGAGWHSVTPERTRAIVPRQQAQLWVHHQVLQVHALRITSDSISGIPYLQPLDCDSCRQTFSRTEVDSVRAGDPSGGFWKSFGLVMAGLVVVAFVAYTGT